MASSLASVRIEAKVIRANGTVEDLGTIAYWSSNVFQRLWYRITSWVKGADAGSVAVERKVEVETKVVADEATQHIHDQIEKLKQTALVRALLNTGSEAEKDLSLLRITGQAMQARIEKMGATGWMEATDLADKLKAEVESGNWLDASIHAAMLHARQFLE